MKNDNLHLYYVAYGTTDGECKHSLVDARNAAEAAATAKSLRGSDYGFTVGVYGMVEEPVK